MSRVWELREIRSFFSQSRSSAILLPRLLRFFFLVFDSSSSSSFFFGSPSIPSILLRLLRLSTPKTILIPSITRNKLLWLWVESALA
ncbi:unnamed protein product [Brassica oleracea]